MSHDGPTFQNVSAPPAHSTHFSKVVPVIIACLLNGSLSSFVWWDGPVSRIMTVTPSLGEKQKPHQQTQYWQNKKVLISEEGLFFVFTSAKEVM